jgi:hypothetical protein
MIRIFKEFQRVVGVSSVAIAAALMSQAAFSQVLDFKEGSFISDCGAHHQISGGSLDLHFPNLVINNPAALLSRTSCSVRVGARIAPGYYISKLTTNITATVLKSPSARAALSVRSSFFGFSITPVSIDLPVGSEINDDISRSTTLKFDSRTNPTWVASWCNQRRSSSGIYQLAIAITGQKQKASDDLIVGMGSFSIAEGSEIELSRCPL